MTSCSELECLQYFSFKNSVECHALAWVADAVLLFQSVDSEEDLIVKPVSLGNVNIIRSLSEYRGNNIRTIEQAELAILLSRVHFKVSFTEFAYNLLK